MKPQCRRRPSLWLCAGRHAFAVLTLAAWQAWPQTTRHALEQLAAREASQRSAVPGVELRNSAEERPALLQPAKHKAKL